MMSSTEHEVIHLLCVLSPEHLSGLCFINQFGPVFMFMCMFVLLYVPPWETTGSLHVYKAPAPISSDVNMTINYLHQFSTLGLTQSLATQAWWQCAELGRGCKT